MIVSDSSEYGEGEHKIFQHIRNYRGDISREKLVVYGLDADLIMLFVNHLVTNTCKRDIFLFRETPEFIKSINANLEPNANYLLDIPALKNALRCKSDDYIFLCFFLGNDFMPHFPSLNIRTNGIYILMNKYSHREPLIDNNGNINWRNVKSLIKRLATDEMKRIIQEYNNRNNDKSPKKDIPMLYRHVEHHIMDAIENTFRRNVESNDSAVKGVLFENTNPKDEKSLMLSPKGMLFENQKEFKRRYYQSLFGIDSEDEAVIRQVCNNYLEGLEWTFKYYSEGCCDWSWKYNYKYPPLFCDLIKHVPNNQTSYINADAPKQPIITEVEQLAYVLPYSSLHFLPKDTYEICMKHLQYYPQNAEMMWAFKRYFWESHVVLPELDFDIFHRKKL